MRTEDEIRADAEKKSPFSNRTEYDIWADRYCYECVHDNPETDTFCPILTVTMLGPAWPREWTRQTITWEDGNNGTKSGSYEVVDTCTEFEERREPGDEPEPEPEPPPACDGQLDLVDAYLDTAIAELTPRLVDSLPERET